MKIRTLLFLILFPLILLSNLTITGLLTFQWHREVSESFAVKLRNSAFYLSDYFEDTPIKDTPLKLEAKDLPLPLESLQQQKISHIYVATPKQMKNLLGDDHPFLNQEDRFNLKQGELSPVYEKNGKLKISALAPIFHANGTLKSYVILEAPMDEMSEKIKGTLLVISISLGLTLLLLSFFAYLFERRITIPIQRLNSSALSIAAGKYGEKIQLKGPKELAELSNTLNIMSECLYENINRLKEKSLQKERWHGEYECSLLLQQLMLEKTIKGSSSDAIAVDAISFYSDEPKGFLLDIASTDKYLTVRLAEAKQDGFTGMYDLLTQYKISSGAKILNENFSHAELKISLDNPQIFFFSHNFPRPIIWSSEEKRLLTKEELHSYELKAGDYFFLPNPYLQKSHPMLEPQMEKVIKNFMDEGFETIVMMLKKKLQHWDRKEDPEEDVHLLCFQWL